MSTVVATEARQAANAISTVMTPLDAVFLDFDLAGKHMLAWGDTDSSTALIEWIGKSPDTLARSKKWILHSLNHAIYDNAKECIPGLIVAPGAWHRKTFHTIMGTGLYGTPGIVVPFAATTDRPEEHPNAR